MAENVSENIRPLVDFYVRWSKESLDMMSKGMDIFNRVTGSALNVSGQPQGARPDDMMKRWADAMRVAYNDMLDMMSQTLRMSGTSPTAGKEATDEAFSRWQQMVSSSPIRSVVPGGADEFMNYMRNWYDGFSRVYQSWLDSVQRMGEASRSSMEEGGKADPVVNSVTESTDRFMHEWAEFLKQQASALSQLLKAQMQQTQDTMREAQA